MAALTTFLVSHLILSLCINIVLCLFGLSAIMSYFRSFCNLKQDSEEDACPISVKVQRVPGAWPEEVEVAPVGVVSQPIIVPLQQISPPKSTPVQAIYSAVNAALPQVPSPVLAPIHGVIPPAVTPVRHLFSPIMTQEVVPTTVAPIQHSFPAIMVQEIVPVEPVSPAIMAPIQQCFSPITVQEIGPTAVASVQKVSPPIVAAVPVIPPLVIAPVQVSPPIIAPVREVIQPTDTLFPKIPLPVVTSVNEQEAPSTMTPVQEILPLTVTSAQEVPSAALTPVLDVTAPVHKALSPAVAPAEMNPPPVFTPRQLIPQSKYPLLFPETVTPAPKISLPDASPVQEVSAPTLATVPEFPPMIATAEKEVPPLVIAPIKKTSSPVIDPLIAKALPPPTHILPSIDSVIAPVPIQCQPIISPPKTVNLSKPITVINGDMPDAPLHSHQYEPFYPGSVATSTSTLPTPEMSIPMPSTTISTLVEEITILYAPKPTPAIPEFPPKRKPVDIWGISRKGKGVARSKETGRISTWDSGSVPVGLDSGEGPSSSTTQRASSSSSSTQLGLPVSSNPGSSSSGVAADSNSRDTSLPQPSRYEESKWDDASGSDSGSSSSGSSLHSSSLPVDNIPLPNCDLSTHPQFDESESMGFLTLSEGVNPIIDIIAIHGLDGHRTRTFTTPNGTNWLAQWLPTDLPTARILTYGYDARTRGPLLSCQSLHQHAMALISDLVLLRRTTKTEKRPIIFLAHCTGGNIIKDALIHSNAANVSNNQAHNAIKTSTTGVVFLGTPHQGTKTASWSQIVGAVRNEQVLEDVEEGSKALDMQLTQYNHISTDFETKFFYETFAPPGAPRGEPIVPKASAVVPGAVNVEEYPIHKDHVNLVKYDSRDEKGYVTVSQVLKLLVESAGSKVKQNWESKEMYADAHNNHGIRMTFDIPLKLENLRNSAFTGRAELLAALDAKVKASAGPVVLWGTGGVGKTQIATQYIYEHKPEYSAVFWLNASSPEQLALSYRAAAQRVITKHAALTMKTNPDYALVAKNLGLGGLVDENGLLVVDEGKDRAIVEGMKCWLGRPGNNAWLLVLDNADDLESFNIKEYIPEESQGVVIMTSRRPRCAALGVGVEVREMAPQEGVKLLLRSANLEHLQDDTTASELTNQLGSLPLALVQAGAYIAARRMSLAEYLSIYDTFFKRIFAEIPTDKLWEYGDRSVLTTWEISYAAIDGQAAELLALCALLSNEIRKDMLCRGKEKGPNDMDITDAISHLFSYSLAVQQHTPGSFYIHPVVHRWALERLSSTQRIQKAHEAVLLVATAVFSSEQKTNHNWRYEAIVMQHIRTVTANAEKYLPDDLMDNSTLTSMCRLGVVYSEWGRYLDAIKIQQRLLDLSRRRFGEKHPITLLSQNNLATTHSKSKNIQDGETMLSEAIQGLRNSFGEEHNSTLDAISNLAGIYCRQGRFEEAEALWVQTLEVRRRTFGEKHPDTLKTIVNLCTVWTGMGKFTKAAEMGFQVVEMMQAVHGKDNLDTLSAVVNLAVTLNELGRLEEAVSLEEVVLKRMSRALGDKHEHTLSVMNNLAITYTKQERHDEAAKLREAIVYAKMDHKVADDDLTTLTLMHNVAAQYCNEGRIDEAESIKTRVLEGRRRLVGDKHDDTLTAMHNLAITYTKQERHDEATALRDEILVAKFKRGDEHDPSTLSGMHNLAAKWCNAGRIEEAEKMKLFVLEARRRVLGDDHKDTLSAVNNLAVTYSKQNRVAEAIALRQQLVDAYIRTQGENHPDTARAKAQLHATKSQRDPELDAIAALEMQEDHPEALRALVDVAEKYKKEGRIGDAELILLRVMKGREASLGEEHPDTISAIASLASIYRMQERWDEAEELEKRLISIQETVFGPDHRDTLLSMLHLASTYWHQSRWEEAEVLEAQVLRSRQKTLGLDHPDTLSAMSSLAVTYRMQGQYPEAEALHHKVAELSERQHGSEHPTTMLAMLNLASAFTSQDRWGDAEPLQRTVMDVRQRQLGAFHPDTSAARAALALTCRKLGWPEPQLPRGSQRAVESVGVCNEQPDTLEEMKDLIESYVHQGRSDDLQQLTLATVERLGASHPVSLYIMSVTGAILRKVGRHDEASGLRDQVVDSLQRSGVDPASVMDLASMI